MASRTGYRADRLVGVSGLAGDPSMPPQPDYPTPPLPMGPASQRLAQAFDRLGWHWWPVPAAVISRDYDGRPCCNNCGMCYGCPRGSMSRFVISVWPKALEAGVELRPYARVLRLEHRRDARAAGAVRSGTAPTGRGWCNCWHGARPRSLRSRSPTRRRASSGRS